MRDLASFSVVGTPISSRSFAKVEGSISSGCCGEVAVPPNAVEEFVFDEPSF